MDHHQVKRSLVFADLLVIVRMLDRKEVFIERNVKFRGKDLLRIKSVVAPKLLQDVSCLHTSALHQGVEYFEVRGAPRSDEARHGLRNIRRLDEGRWCGGTRRPGEVSGQPR